MKHLVTTAAILASSFYVNTLYAQDEHKPNPADMTQVNTFVYGQQEESTTRGMVGLSGSYSEGNVFMGLAEHSYNHKEKAHSSRLRYFQVLDTGLKAMPQAGVSVDYIKGYNPNSDVLAVGTIAKMLTPWDAFTVYPNLAYVKGRADGQDINGYQVNLFTSLSIDNLGKYVVFQPQYMDTNVGSQLKVKTGFGMPLEATGKWWWDVGHEYQKITAKHTHYSDDHKFSVGIAYYF